MGNIVIEKSFEEITYFGGLGFYAFLCVLFLVLNRVQNFFQIIFALFIIFLITLVIRTIYFKPRPKKIHYETFLEKINASSFPSVHAARIVFISLFLIIIFSLKTYLIALIFIIMLLVLYSRIYLKKHDIIDILGGIILGLISLISLILI